MDMRTVLRIALLLLLVTAAAGAIRRYEAKRYRHEVTGPRALGGAAAHAAIGQARNSPHERGQGAGGFAKRVGSSLGQHAVKGAIELGVGAWHHENLHYQRSNLHGTLPRMKYALKSTFLVPKTNRPGKKTVALGRVSGNLGAGVISRAWQPASSAGIGAGLASGGIGLGADVGVNMAREFWPHKHRKAARTAAHKAG
jgi:hypothetical protein